MRTNLTTTVRNFVRKLLKLTELLTFEFLVRKNTISNVIFKNWIMSRGFSAIVEICPSFHDAVVSGFCHFEC